MVDICFKAWLFFFFSLRYYLNDFISEHWEPSKSN